MKSISTLCLALSFTLIALASAPAVAAPYPNRDGLTVGPFELRYAIVDGYEDQLEVQMICYEVFEMTYFGSPYVTRSLELRYVRKAVEGGLTEVSITHPEAESLANPFQNENRGCSVFVQHRVKDPLHFTQLKKSAATSWEFRLRMESAGVAPALMNAYHPIVEGVTPTIRFDYPPRDEAMHFPTTGPCGKRVLGKCIYVFKMVREGFTELANHATRNDFVHGGDETGPLPRVPGLAPVVATQPGWGDVLGPIVITTPEVQARGVCKEASMLGYACSMNQPEAFDYCLNQNPESEREVIRQALARNEKPARGIYLPLPRQLAEEAVRLGAKAIRETLLPGVTVKDARVASEVEQMRKEGYFAVYTQSTGSKTVDFYLNSSGYRRPDAPLGTHWYWSASVDPEQPSQSIHWRGDHGNMFAWFSSVRHLHAAVRCVGQQ